MRFLRFSVQQALQGLWRNRVMNIAATVTMVLMLVLLATLVIIISGIEAGLAFIEAKVEVRAELHDGLRDESISQFQQRLDGLAEVASTSARSSPAWPTGNTASLTYSTWGSTRSRPNKGPFNVTAITSSGKRPMTA